MARNTIQHEHTPPEGGKVETGGVPITGLDSVPEGQIPSEAPVMRASVAKSNPKVKDVPPPKRYIVVKQAAVLLDGSRSTLPEGKVLDSLNYDIDHLKRLGVKLQPYTEE
jgi:hypothetical protein